MKQIDIQMRSFRLKGDNRTLFCTEAKCDYNLNVLGVYYIPIKGNVLPDFWMDKKSWHYLPGSRLKEIDLQNSASLGGAYEPAAELPGAYRMNILTPDSMDESTSEALKQLKKAVGNVAEFVAERLQYSLAELAECLSLEQIDAVALAIYNCEAREQGIIIGDQTGIGKGRVASAFIRYAVKSGKKPIFFTEKPGLFSDIYRDLTAIHSDDLRPLIVNASGGNILDEDGNEVRGMAYSKTKLEAAMREGKVPDDCDFVCVTYSQLRTDDSNQKYSKCNFISEIAKDNILVLDESHNAGGEVTYHSKTKKFTGNTGLIFQTKILPFCKGIMYLSATYAKYPKNMPIYAMNTCISDISKGWRKEELRTADATVIVDSLSSVKGYFNSLPAQEIISSALCRYGQFVRRERKTEGMQVNYITLDSAGAADFGVRDLKAEHYEIYTCITKIISDIRDFQESFVIPYLEEEAKRLAKQGNRTQKGASVANASIFSSLFHIVNNVLLSIKSESIADRAIKHLSEGRKVVIALADTNESAIDSAEEEEGSDVINADYSGVFVRAFRSLLRYYVTEGRTKTPVPIEVEELGAPAEREFNEIVARFKRTTTGLCMSPIDVITKRIEDAGYSVAECTGRSRRLDLSDGIKKARIVKAAKYSAQQGKHVSLCYNNFNNNKVDVLIINQSGSTGKSAHATAANTTLKESEVKQRVMIIAQAELDINTEVQKRGRINRTGQLSHIPPLYEYLYSAIPCEKRFMMMLKAKLKSLDANTTANQRQSSDTVLETPDFFNKYGDAVVESMLNNDWATNHVLNDPLGIEPNPITHLQDKSPADEMARTAFGRMQVLSPDEQEKWYNNVLAEYNELIEDLKAKDEYDLEVKDVDYQAELLSEGVLKPATSSLGGSELTGASFISRYSVKPQNRLASAAELTDRINRNVDSGQIEPDAILAKIAAEQKEYAKVIKETEKKYIAEGLQARVQAIVSQRETREKKYKRMCDLLKKLKAGAVFEFEGNYYVLVRCYISDPKADLMSRSSAVLVSFKSTDLDKSDLTLNLADAGLEQLEKITATKATLKDYEKFLSKDKRKVELNIITGNFVRHMEDEGTVVTRFTLADGNKETGIIVKEVVENGVRTLPEWARYVSIPLNRKVVPLVYSSLDSDGATVTFRNKEIDADIAIQARRVNDDMLYYLKADARYRDFLGKPEMSEFYADKINGLKFTGGYFTGGLLSSKVKDLIAYFAEFEMSVRVARTALDKYADVIDNSRYKATDWVKLSYDKKKIPTNYVPKKKVKISPILIAELQRLSKKDCDFEIINYSEKAWAVIGDTKKYKEALKDLGGKWNARLSCGAGWVISKKYTEEDIYKKLTA